MIIVMYRSKTTCEPLAIYTYDSYDCFKAIQSAKTCNTDAMNETILEVFPYNDDLMVFLSGCVMSNNSRYIGKGQSFELEEIENIIQPEFEKLMAEGGLDDVTSDS